MTVLSMSKQEFSRLDVLLRVQAGRLRRPRLRGSRSNTAFDHAATHPASQSAHRGCVAPAMLRSFHAWAEDAAWSTPESRGTACSPG
jgi:hypothetical protein